MAVTLPKPQTEQKAPERYRFTVEQFEKMWAEGVFPEGTRVELVEGDIYQMPPMGDEHVDGLAVFIRVLTSKLGDKAVVLSQVPIRIPQSGGLPEPDYVVLNPEVYTKGVPRAEAVLFVVEISDTTLAYDRGPKLRTYATSGIPEVWILNVQAKKLEVYRDPEGEEYRTKQTYDEGQPVAPLAFPEVGLEWW